VPRGSVGWQRARQLRSGDTRNLPCLLRLSGERRGQGTGHRGQQEAAAAHAGTVGRLSRRTQVRRPRPPRRAMLAPQSHAIQTIDLSTPSYISPPAMLRIEGIQVGSAWSAPSKHVAGSATACRRHQSRRSRVQVSGGRRPRRGRRACRDAPRGGRARGSGCRRGDRRRRRRGRRPDPPQSAPSGWLV